jgi:hypothetical protein
MLRLAAAARSIASAPEDQDRGIAALAQIDLRRHRDQRYPVAAVQPLAERVHAGRVHLLRHEELARPVGRDLTRAGDRVAGEADDMVVVEDRDGCRHEFHLLGGEPKP